MTIPTCPICHDPLEPIALPRGDTPPWNCPRDARSFWEAELTVVARDAFDPDTRTYRADVRRDIMAAVESECRAHRQAQITPNDRSFEVMADQAIEQFFDSLPPDHPSKDRRPQ